MRGWVGADVGSYVSGWVSADVMLYVCKWADVGMGMSVWVLVGGCVVCL